MKFKYGFVVFGVNYLRERKEGEAAEEEKFGFEWKQGKWSLKNLREFRPRWGADGQRRRRW